jgi:transcription antitermination factor NusG
VSPASRNLASESQGDGQLLEAAAVQKSELEQLIEALPFAESIEDFASIIEDSPLEAVEDAIALSGDQPRRQQLRSWLEALQKSSEPSLGFKLGDCLKRIKGVFEGQVAMITEVLDWGIETSLGTVAFIEISGWDKC